LAYRLAGNPHDADDLVQETFVRALPRLDRLDPETTDVAPYLFTTLHNLFLKSVERGRRAEPVADVPEPSVPAPIEDDPERSTLLHNQQEDVRLANARLAPRQRLVLALRELEDRSYAEIGTVVGLNENAVAQLISRARESLRTELRLAEVDPSSLPEECRKFLPLLSRHLDGHLGGAELEKTLAHLESCERCQDALVSMREAQRRYRTLLPIFGGGDDQRAKIDAELTSAGYWARRPPLRPRFHDRRAVVAATVALLLAGAGGVGAAVVVSRGGPKAAPTVTSLSHSTSTTTATKATTRGTTTRAVTRTRRRVTTTVAPIVPPTTKPATTVIADTTAPTVTILARPPAKAPSTYAFISFRASERSVSLSCRRDTHAFARCSSPVIYHGLRLGAHTFVVRARDKAGNTGPPQTVRWTVLQPPVATTPTTVTAPPLADLVISALTGTSFTVTNIGSAAAGKFVVDVTPIGSFSFAGLKAGESVTRTFTTCTVGTLTAVADSSRRVAESNEDNNSRSLVSNC
jgi:RNA polymerase sigma-70 factor (ECF subfamily)